MVKESWLGLIRGMIYTHDHVSYRVISNVNFDRQETVADVVSNGSWSWRKLSLVHFPSYIRNNAISIFGRLIVAATSYFVWQERNNRVHGNGERQPEQLSKIVVNMVRLKLASIRFKKKVRAEQMRRTWKILSIISDGG
nr:hypothetical protein [Tanacetum cinerariifolium]